ncbi:MAG: MASE1 domain-containing protein [Myxococcus sp.]|nr:MASE1 domain-containing protein [Myxococcus sp.]
MLKQWSATLGLAAVYFAAAWLGLQVAVPPGNATALWLPSGIALATVLLLGRRVWPGIALGAFAVNLAFFPTPSPAGDVVGALAIAAGSTSAILLAAFAIERLGGRAILSTAPGVIAFVAVTLGAALLSASVGLLATMITGELSGAAVPRFWLTWWLGDTVGMLAVAPLVLTTGAGAQPRRVAEGVALTLLTLAVTQTLFGRPLPWPGGTAMPLTWLVFVSLTWAGARFKAPMVAAQTLLLYAMASWGTLVGRGPLAGLAQPTALLVLDALLVTVLLSALLLSAAQSVAARTREALEDRVRERTDSLQQSHQALLTQREERARIDARLSALEKEEALGRLAGGVAHDFNNLLTVITSSADLINLDRAASAETRDAAQAVLAAAERAAELTRHLLAVARRQPGKARPVDLVAVLADLRRLVRPILPENITLDVELMPLTVSIDPTQLEQVLLNLAINARDAMTRGGRLVITVSPRVLDPAEAAALDVAPGDWALIAVTDDGDGMSPEVQQRIFEPFFTTKPAPVGTGLGLSSALGIVRQAGGAIRVTSALGRGSTFEVWLPAVVAAPVDAPAAPAVVKPVQRETILLVEDEAMVRRVVATTLERAGYHVLVAADGEEGLALARSRRAEIALVLTDVVMPRLGGFDLARALRAEGPVRVLFMSGYNELQRELADEVVLTKPFAASRLLAAVGYSLGEAPR